MRIWRAPDQQRLPIGAVAGFVDRAADSGRLAQARPQASFPVRASGFANKPRPGSDLTLPTRQKWIRLSPPSVR
jgi:hypothetical protein